MPGSPTMSWWQARPGHPLARLPARPLARLAGAAALAALLAACGAGPTGNPVGAPPLAPSTTRQTGHKVASAPTKAQPKPVPTTTHLPSTPPRSAHPRPPARKVATRPKPPLLPRGTRSGVGNTPEGAPWETPGAPEQVAARWVTGFFEVLWDQPGPNAWAGRVRPLTAPAYWKVLSRGIATPTPAEAAAWHKVVAERELDQVGVLSAYRVDEAGYSATREVVLVDYDVSVRTDADPDAPTGPAQPIYLTMDRLGGHWLVAGSWAPLANGEPAATEPSARSALAKP